MKYIKEYIDIDFEDWDEEEVEPMEWVKVNNLKELSKGDIVICDNVGPYPNKNIIGRLLTDPKDNHIGMVIEFEKNINGHNGVGGYRGKDGHCWFIWFEDDHHHNIRKKVKVNESIDWDDWDEEEIDSNSPLTNKDFVKFLKDNDAHDKFIYNYNKTKPNIKIESYCDLVVPFNYIYDSFPWRTPEGFKFWDNLNDKWTRSKYVLDWKFNL